MAAVVAAGWLRPRVALAALLAWVPLAMVLAGVPLASLAPRNVPSLFGQLATAPTGLTAPASVRAETPWPLAVVLLGSGVSWIAGGALGASAPASSRRRLAAGCLLAAPWLAAASVGTGDSAPWLGGVALLGALVWLTPSRAALAIGVVVALSSVAAAQALGPRSRWFDSGAHAATPAFRALDPEPSYGTPEGRRTGAAMLKIQAARPALWRMQTLDHFDGAEWAVSPTPMPELAQPAARLETVNVRVMGLRDSLVVAPGRIEGLSVRGTTMPALGDAWRVDPEPPAGSTYDVTADSVEVSAAQLARDRAPIGPDARAYTRVGPTPESRRALEQLARAMAGTFGVRLSALTRTAPDPRVVALARRLSSGAATEWEVVSRVERFLLDPHRFRYTTHLPPAGPQPLVDFLVHTHAGHCQHFAGAAALLLRLAGVPARVVSGFATGVETAPGQYTVRDLDAHAWIEVYFPSYGWVPFNPTPAGARASVANGIDPLVPASAPPRARQPAAVAVLALLALLAVGGASTRRRTRRSHDPMQQLLERVARRTGTPVEPSLTLRELRAALVQLGPRTAALAAEAELTRFAADAPAPARHARLRLARALIRDLGMAGALRAYLPPSGRPQ